MKAIIKNRNHPSISEIKNKISGKTFELSRISEKDIVKKIKKLSTKKSVQSTKIPLKVIKENVDIFGSYLCELFSNCINKAIF